MADHPVAPALKAGAKDASQVISLLRADKLSAYGIEPNHLTIWRNVENEIAGVANNLQGTRVERH